MKNALQRHFPMIRDRAEVLAEIRSHENLSAIFDEWTEKAQEEFLNFCTGVKGVKLLYDSFFKEIMNPDATPERLEEVISLIIGESVQILNILPNDSARIAAESSLLIMDIVIQLKNGSVANVEVQKIGYAFPGQRSACYSADLLLRQYKRIKGEKGKKFSYKDIKKVYTIVFIENSTGEFHKCPEQFMHHSRQVFDSGIHIELLQEYVFIPLDIFRNNLHNKSIDINNKIVASLTFLSVDEPHWILHLIETHPEFESLYEEVYNMCLNMEQVMNMFSEELMELDRNTVQYMIDEMQEQIDAQQEQIGKQQEKIGIQQGKIDSQKRQLEELQTEINKLQLKLRQHQID